MQACCHRPRLDADRGRDRFVVEVGVVTEEQDESLALGERGDERGQRPAFDVSVRRRRIARRESRAQASFDSLSTARLVHHDPEEPAIERAAPVESAPVPERPHEGVVHGLLSELLVAHDRNGDTQKGAVSLAIDALDLVRLHHLKTQSRAFSFSDAQRGQAVGGGGTEADGDSPVRVPHSLAQPSVALKAQPGGAAVGRLKETERLGSHSGAMGARLDDLETAYREHLPQFRRVAAAIVGDEERGRDAVQDAFGRAIRRRRTFRGSGPLEAWVWRLIVNAARDQARRPLARSLDDLPGELPEAAGNGASPHADELRVAIALLPERQRLVLFLRYYADLDYAAIAAALEIAPGAVAATLHAAHAALRRTFQEVPR